MNMFSAIEQSYTFVFHIKIPPRFSLFEGGCIYPFMTKKYAPTIRVHIF